MPLDIFQIQIKISFIALFYRMKFTYYAQYIHYVNNILNSSSIKTFNIQHACIHVHILMYVNSMCMCTHMHIYIYVKMSLKQHGHVDICHIYTLYIYVYIYTYIYKPELNVKMT